MPLDLKSCQLKWLRKGGCSAHLPDHRRKKTASSEGKSMSADAPSVNAPGYGLPNRRTLLVLYLPILALLFLVAIIARFGHIPLSSLTRDLAAIAHVHPLIGFVSN